QREAFTVRKPEKGTIPKVFYIAAEESAIQPEIATRPFIYKEGQVLLRPLGSPTADPSRPGDPRVDYDVPHVKPWGLDMAFYLLTKGIGTGAMFLSALLWLIGVRTPLTMVVGPAIGLVFVTLTAAILIVDLERPERFLFILFRPNWRSWMVWGAYFLTAHGAIATGWILAGWFGLNGVLALLAIPAMIASILATSYTGFLFAQGLARDLWQGPHAAFDLLAQAIIEGAAAMLIALALAPPVRVGGHAAAALGLALGAALAVHLLILAIEQLTPSPTRHHELAARALSRGAFAPYFWGGAIVGGGVLPLALLGAASVVGTLQSPALAVGISLLSLLGAFAWEYVWVEAGQSVPLS